MMSDDPRLAIAGYLNGELTLSERQQFERSLASDSDLAAEVAEVVGIWNQLGLLPNEETPSAALRARFYQSLNARNQRRSFSFGWLRAPAFQAAAAAVLFCLGLSIGLLSHRSTQPVGETQSEQLAQMRGQVQSLREMVALSLLDRQSASSRLQGVSWSNQIDQPNTELLSALQSALNHDPNVNVRLSSLSALERYGSQDSVRRALLDSIPRQESPLVQIALIDSLVNLKERSAMSEFQRLSETGQLNPAVRQRAKAALVRLETFNK